MILVSPRPNGGHSELNGQFQELSLEGTFAVLLLPIVLKKVFLSLFFFFGLIVNVLNLKDTQIH